MTLEEFVQELTDLMKADHGHYSTSEVLVVERGGSTYKINSVEAESDIDHENRGVSWITVRVEGE